MNHQDEAVERSIKYLNLVIESLVVDRQKAIEFTQSADKQIEQFNKVIEQLKGKPTAVPVLLKREQR